MIGGEFMNLDFDNESLQQYTEYICPKCKVKENIPTEIVMDFEFRDGGSPNYCPTFTCEKCNSDMVPIYFVGYTGRVYKYEEK